MTTAKRVALPELLRRLGEPAGSGVCVMFAAERAPEYRSARMLWLCDPVNSADPNGECPSNCIAWNRLPYTTVEFDPKNFPQDAWVLVPCEKHTYLFIGYPDVPVQRAT